MYLCFYFDKGRHVAPLTHIFLTSSQPVVDLTPLDCVLSREAKTKSIVFRQYETHKLSQSRPVHHNMTDTIKAYYYINTFVVLAAAEAISVLSDKRQVIVEENRRGR